MTPDELARLRAIWEQFTWVVPVQDPEMQRRYQEAMHALTRLRWDAEDEQRQRGEGK